MPVWATLIVALAVGLLGAAFDRRDTQEPTAEAQRRPLLRRRLEGGIKRHKTRVSPSVALALLLLLLGCRSQMILVPQGEPVRLLESVRARVESVDKDGKTVVGRATIPAGWYALPDPGDSP